jgi:hypothetical protein
VTSLSSGDIVVRPAREDDGPALEAFRCASGPDYEQDVEDFIHREALQLALSQSPDEDYRLLLVLDRGRLAGCIAHHLEALLLAESTLEVTRLGLCALALTDQGRRLDGGRRLSDLVMETLIADAVKTRGTAVLTAIVARDNLRSIRLCERSGLRSQIRHNVNHIRLWGVFAGDAPSRVPD